MFAYLHRLFSSTKEIRAEVVSRVRVDAEHYNVKYSELGTDKPYERTYSTYGPDGRKAPKPRVGSTAVLRINRRNKIVYSGDAR